MKLLEKNRTQMFYLINITDMLQMPSYLRSDYNFNAWYKECEQKKHWQSDDQQIRSSMELSQDAFV